jgi:hypothetical protein
MRNKYVKVGDVYINTTTGDRISKKEFENETNTETKKPTRKNSRAKTK